MSKLCVKNSNMPSDLPCLTVLYFLFQNSYCTGETGRENNDRSELPDTSSDTYVLNNKANQEPKTLVEIHQELRRKAAAGEDQDKDKEGSSDSEEDSDDDNQRKDKKKDKEGDNSSRREKKAAKRREKKKKARKNTKKNKKRHSSSSSSSEDEDEEEKKAKELANALEAEEKRNRDADTIADDRKRGYNSRYDVKAPTEMELEAYLLKRSREEDPMASFMASKKKK